MIEKILVAIDGSDHARKAVGYASDMASKYDATLYFVHVVCGTEVLKDVLEYGKLERAEKPPLSVYLQKIGEEILRKAETEAREKGAKNIQSTVVQGDPAEKIIEFARQKGVDMIVIGSRGLGNIKGLFLGSVSHKVCHLADQTCVTVK